MRSKSSAIFLWLVTLLASALNAQESKQANFDDFERFVRPILSQHCYECHSSRAKRIEGQLRLDHPTFLRKGGDSGPAISTEQLDQSLLLQAIRYDGLEMPPTGKLDAKEIEVLTQWVRNGAAWPDEPIPVGDREEKTFDLKQRMESHWVWKPIADPIIPDVHSGNENANSVDAFVFAKQRDEGLQSAPQANRETLIRRLHWDLTGLPPTMDVVNRWKQVESEDWYEQLLDSLLADPQFGVRFGRHWLDLVRYAESRGHEFDEDSSGAEHYRDYVIRTWNTDLPFDEVLREHIAGDLLTEPRRHPVTLANESVLGTGFWHLGEWVHSPVNTRKDETDRFDNMVDVFSKTFLGITVSCARCHDHKFDPISAEDYYALNGFLRSSHFRMVRFETDRVEAEIRRRLEVVRDKYRSKWKASIPRLLDEAALETLTKQFDRKSIPSMLDASDPRVKLDSRSLKSGEFHANGEAFGDSVSPSGFDSLSLSGINQEASRVTLSGVTSIAADPIWFRQKSNVKRVNSSNRNNPVDFAHRTYLSPSIVLDSDQLSLLVRGSIRVFVAVDSHRLINGPLHSETFFESEAKSPDALRWVTSKSLSRYQGKRIHIEVSPTSDHPFHLYQVIAGEAPKEVRGESATIQMADVRRWLGSSPESGTPDTRTAFAVAQFWEEWISTKQSAKESDPIVVFIQDLIKRWGADEEAIIAQLPIESKVAMAMIDGSGQNDYLLIRGNADKPSHEVPRRFLEALGGTGNSLHEMPGSGRLQLAEQMLRRDNPLVARVFVNRLWQHLMGRGIVATPDDFGVQGQAPSHPELLDHLSVKLWNDSWSPKRIIRHICLSHTYRQVVSKSGFPGNDPDNRFLSFASIKKLEGEAVRDGLFSVTGQLDYKVGGGVVPVHLTDFMTGRGRPKESGPMHGEGRRSIFLEVRRNFLNPFLSAFDMPNPFSSMGKRNTSNVPAQALTLMNDPMIHWLAKQWALNELRREATDDRRIRHMIESVKSRACEQRELELGLEFLKLQRETTGGKSVAEREESVWTDFAHALLNSKELLFCF